MNWPWLFQSLGILGAFVVFCHLAVLYFLYRQVVGTLISNSSLDRGLGDRADSVTVQSAAGVQNVGTVQLSDMQPRGEPNEANDGEITELD